MSYGPKIFKMSYGIQWIQNIGPWFDWIWAYDTGSGLAANLEAALKAYGIKICKINNRAGWNKQTGWIFFDNLIREQGGKYSKEKISDNFGSEFALCTVWDEMYTLPCSNKSCLQCSSSMCLFRQNGINELKGQNPRDNKRAGDNKNKQRGQNIEKW